MTKGMFFPAGTDKVMARVSDAHPELRVPLGCRRCQQPVGQWFLCGCGWKQGPDVDMESFSTTLTDLRVAAAKALRNRAGSQASEVEPILTIKSVSYTFFLRLTGALPDASPAASSLSEPPPEVHLSYPAGVGKQSKQDWVQRRGRFSRRTHTVTIKENHIVQRMFCLHESCNKGYAKAGYNQVQLNPTTGCARAIVAPVKLTHVFDRNKGTNTMKVCFSAARMDPDQGTSLPPTMKKRCHDGGMGLDDISVIGWREGAARQDPPPLGFVLHAQKTQRRETFENDAVNIKIRNEVLEVMVKVLNDVCRKCVGPVQVDQTAQPPTAAIQSSVLEKFNF